MTTRENYRISDFILDSLKCVLIHLAFYAVGFVVYAASVGHIMSDKQADVSAKHSALTVFSAGVIALFVIVICSYAKKNIGRRTQLIEASRADDFDSKLYYKNIFKQKVLPLAVGGIIAQLPYTIFYTCFGWDYLFPSIVDRFYSSSMFFFSFMGGILGTLVHNAVIAGVFALSLYRMQKRELDDRMWLKDAPKQEEVHFSKPKDRYKDY